MELPIKFHACPRADRLCLHCNQHALGDEYHMLFDYHMLFECAATQAAREPYIHLFPRGCTMSSCRMKIPRALCAAISLAVMRLLLMSFIGCSWLCDRCLVISHLVDSGLEGRCVYCLWPGG